MNTSTLSKIILFILAISLLGCTRTTSTSTPEASATPAITETVTPTPLPSRVVFVFAPGDDPSLVGQVNTALVGLSSQAGLTAEQRSDIQLSDLSSDIKVVAFASNPANLNDLVSAAGNIQFIVISEQDISPSANLTIIRLHPEYSLFIAGYIAEMISADWRAAGLIPSDIPQSDLLQQAFQNGGRYWCGICREEHPPYADFPLVAALPAASDANAWKAAVDQLETNRIYTLVAWDLMDTPEVLQYISVQSVYTELGPFIHPILLGNQVPQDVLRPSWALTLTPDVATPLQAAWADVMAGTGGRTFHAGVKMIEINETLFGIGKQRLADETIQKLVLGLIDPFNP